MPGIIHKAKMARFIANLNDHPTLAVTHGSCLSADFGSSRPRRNVGGKVARTTKPPLSRRLSSISVSYPTIRYVRSPVALFVDSTFRPNFFVTCPLTNPRML